MSVKTKAPGQEVDDGLGSDAQSWLEHMCTSSAAAVRWIEHAVQAMDANARSYALISKFGTNPAANLNQVIEDTLKQYRNSDPDAVRKLQTQAPQLKNTMGRLDGSLNAPVNADRPIGKGSPKPS